MGTPFRTVVCEALERLGSPGVASRLDERRAVASLLREPLDREPPPEELTLGARALARRATILLEEEGDLDLEGVRRLLRAAMPPAPAMPDDAPAPPAPTLSLAETDGETLREFVAEATDYLAAAEAALLTLEDAPEEPEAIGAVFRAFHTIKGLAGFLGLRPVADLSHHAESLLGRIRSGELRCEGPVAELAFESLDALRALIVPLAQAEEGAELPVPDGYARILGRLTDAATIVSAPRAELPVAPLELAERTLAAVADVKATRADPDATIRVRTDRLDRLIDMVGELVIAQAMVWEDELIRSPGATVLQNKVAAATKITRELHDSTLSLRMVPLRATFQKVARVARDVSRKVDRAVQVVIEGDDTEIDRNTVELLADPLIHMVRNAIDHGIEPTAARAEAGKPPTATLTVRASRAGSDVVIEVEDDGKGIDPVVIFRKAVERGLVEPDAQLTEAATLALIFEPGFSTRDAVTEISGRGVGMDVVKRAVEALKGSVAIHSIVGQGTRFTVRLPLTLAMTNGLLVRVGGYRYVIPLANIAESVRPTPDVLCTVAERGEFVSTRGELLPTIRLATLFHLPSRPIEQGILVILTADSRRFAVLVDELLGQQQVVAKSLGPLGAAPTIAGGAILGDGRVGLILDAAGLLSCAMRGSSGRESIPSMLVERPASAAS